MRKRVALKIAVSPLVLGATMVGCSTTQSTMFRPAPTSAKEARADQQSSRYYELAQQAAQKGDLGESLNLAEKAVEQSPRDAGYRMLLGDLYLKNGRFLSAETAFSDVLTLHPDNSRARFNLALAQIALGKQYAALVQLDRLSETASPADLGLAYALAGQPARAVAMLEPAARAMDATGRVRQNLALAYALTGDWQRARITASQDLSPADLQPRMEQWASFVQPKASHDQVASMLGVTPAQDAGQPVRLALAPATPEPAALARAEMAPELRAEAPALAEIAPAAPQAESSASGVQYAEAVQTLVAPVQADVAPTAAPIRAFVPAPAKPEAPRRGTAGRYVVQLGAYNNARIAAQAWSRLQGRYDLGNFSPVKAVVSLPGGTFHRLSVGGFSNHAEAASLCKSIKGKGGACFVRGVAGDAPIRFATRSVHKS